MGHGKGDSQILSLVVSLVVWSDAEGQVLTAGPEGGRISLCVSGVVTRLVETCLQVVGWSAWTVNLSCCWPVLDEVQDQVGDTAAFLTASKHS